MGKFKVSVMKKVPHKHEPKESRSDLLDKTVYRSNNITRDRTLCNETRFTRRHSKLNVQVPKTGLQNI